MVTYRTAKPDLHIILVLLMLCKKHRKNYTFPNQGTILWYLKTTYRIIISRRTLCRHMYMLESAGYLTRQQRHARCRIRGFVFRSTLYSVSRSAIRLLSGCKTSVAPRFFGVPSTAHSVRVPPMAQYGSTSIKDHETKPKSTTKPTGNHTTSKEAKGFVSSLRDALRKKQPPS